MISAVQEIADSRTAATTGTTPTRINASPARLRTLMAAGRKLDTHDPAVVRQTATQFLSELFFAPLLAEARQSTLGGELAHGGQTESMFGQRLDQMLADSVAGADPSLVDHMVRHFEQFAERCSPGSDKAGWPTRTQLKQQAEGALS